LSFILVEDVVVLLVEGVVGLEVGGLLSLLVQSLLHQSEVEFVLNDLVRHPCFEGSCLRNDFIVGILGYHLVATSKHKVLGEVVVPPACEELKTPLGPCPHRMLWHFIQRRECPICK